MLQIERPTIYIFFVRQYFLYRPIFMLFKTEKIKINVKTKKKLF